MLSGHPLRKRNRPDSTHEVWRRAPALARLTAFVASGHITAKTQRSYDSATKHYVRFCNVHGVAPFPVDPVWLTQWMNFAACLLSIPSVKLYLSAIRSTQIDLGYEWHLTGNMAVRRTFSGLRRRFGDADKAIKVPITLKMLSEMCLHIPGYPNPNRMRHNDLLFVAASTIAICGFLRGGEFLVCNGSARPLLRRADIRTIFRDRIPSLVVNIAQPKTKWWLTSSDVNVFAPPNAFLSPFKWYNIYLARCPRSLPDTAPAFYMYDGSPLSKQWMLRRSDELLRLAGIELLDQGGQAVKTKASSWRTGGVGTAKDAGLSDELIKLFGRWTSSAWGNYYFASVTDAQRASEAMFGTIDAPQDPAFKMGKLSASKYYEIFS